MVVRRKHGLARAVLAHPSPPVSRREVEEAELFFSELTGTPALRSRERPVPAPIWPAPVRAWSPAPAEAGVAVATASPCDVSAASESLHSFAYDDATLTAAHRARIRALATCVVATRALARPIRVIDVVGHADPQGADDYNRALGDRPAQAVRAALIAEIHALAAGYAVTLTIRAS